MTLIQFSEPEGHPCMLPIQGRTGTRSPIQGDRSIAPTALESPVTQDCAFLCRHSWKKGGKKFKRRFDLK